MKTIATLITMLILTVCGFANAADSPPVTPEAATSFVGAGPNNCKTCEAAANNPENSCYRDFSPGAKKNCPATAEKILDGVEKPATDLSKPVAK